MSIVNGENLFLLMMGLLFLGGFFLGPVLLLMYILLPKAVLKEYFKPPFFRPMEVEMFTGIPYAAMRTVMLMWILAFPRFGEKRNLTEAYKLAPHWYRILSGLFAAVIIGCFVGVLAMGASFYIYFDLLGNT